MKISVKATYNGELLTSDFHFFESHVHMDTLTLLGRGLLFDLGVDKAKDPDWSIWIDGERVVASGTHLAIDMRVADGDSERLKTEGEVDWSFGGTVKLPESMQIEMTAEEQS